MTRGNDARAIRLGASEKEMLLGIYRGRISSIPCDSLGDKAAYDRATGTWRNVGTVSPNGRAWFRLKEAGLLVDYDSFGGFHYCHITELGERTAEQLIAIAAAAREGGDAKQAPGNAPQSGAESALPNLHGGIA